jgi:hypothetical protein
MLWFEQWLEWWRWLIPSWHVVHESAKNQILGVNPLGQHVHFSSCHTCGILCEMPEPHGARGAFAGECLALQAGPLMGNP